MVIVAACIAANLPFVNQRLLAAGPARWHRTKACGCVCWSWWCCTLWSVLFALLLEQRAGQIAPNLEFYAITGTLFVTLAFPGFVYRYLVRHRGA